MKKITLLSALVVAGMATAQVQMTNGTLELKKVEAQRIEMNKEIALTDFEAKQFTQAETTYAGVDYYEADGLFRAGLTAEWGNWGAMLMLPALQDSVTWVNLMGATTWTTGGAVVAENSPTYTRAGYFGTYNPLKTTDHVLTTDTGDVTIKGYVYGEGISNQLIVGGVNHALASDGSIVPLTLCGMFADPLMSPNGRDLYAIEAASLGCPYSFGTDLSYKGFRFDTIISTVRNLNPMKIYQINIPVYNINDAGLDVMLPEGAKVKVEILAADLKNGKFYTDSIYGSTIINIDDCIDNEDGSGTLIAKFYEEDIIGNLTETEIIALGDFCLQLTGFNEAECDFGLLSDYYNPGLTTYFKMNGKTVALWSSGNLGISYDAYWPTIVNDTTENTLNAPIAGGVAYYGNVAEDNVVALLSTVFDAELWSFEVPEWVKFDYSDQNLAKGVMLLQFAADALPAGEAGRVGVITIDADGFVYEMTIKQGEVQDPATGVENVESVLNGKIFNLLGVEVDENYKGIVIKNGKKFIQ